MAWNEPGPGHDPWNQGPGGKRGGGPPDLEKLIKRLKSSFGRGPGGRPAPGKPLALAVAVLAVLWLVSGFYTVDAQEQAVVLRFGAISGQSGAGLGWHLPWPIGSVEKVNVTKLRQATTQSTLLTSDRNLVDVGLTVQFRVSSAPDYLFKVQDPDDTLGQAANSTLRSVVATYTVDQVLGSSQKDIATKVMQRLQKTLDGYHCGLHVTDVSLNQVQPPDAVQDAFADAIKAADDSQRMKDSAQAYAQGRLPQARSQAAQLITDAQTYRDRVVSKAQGDTARFDALLNEYRKAPKLTRERMYIDTMGDILKRSRTVLVDSGKNAPTLHLSLDGGTQEAQLPPSSGKSSSSAPSKSAKPGAGSSDGGDDDNGSADSTAPRSRDRGDAR